jgi:SAM-dependent methyltransferase
MSFSIPHLSAPVPPTLSRVEWEESTCPLCDSGIWSLLLEAPDRLPAEGNGLWFAVVQCQNCGLCFTNPRPSRATIGQFYPESYRPHDKRPSPTAGLGRTLGRGRRRGDRHRRPLSGKEGSRLLDFGCGSGTFLAEMHRQGWHVIGVDSSAAAIERVRAELGLPALVGTLPHPELKDSSFDVITMWHSLEHVHEPLEVLRKAHRLLVSRGRLVVAVPSIASLAFRWFGAAWYGLDLPRHLTHFTPKTLGLMLERAGFRPGPIRMARRSSWMRWSARLVSQDPAHPRWQRWLSRPGLSRLATWYSFLARQSDCLIVSAER